MAAAIVPERALAAVSLVLRVVTLLLLTASLVIIVTNKVYGPFSDVQDPPDFTFRDVYAYRSIYIYIYLDLPISFFSQLVVVVEDQETRAVVHLILILLLSLICFVFFLLRYVLSAAVIGCAYSLVVLPFAAIHVAQQGRKVGRGGARVLLIFTDAVSIMLFFFYSVRDLT